MSVRDIAVVGFAHAPHVRRTDGTTNGVEMLMPCFAQLYDELGITKADIGFWCSGSSDYLAGRAFSFISAIDSIGAVPPINESHVEMDAAWALYEAYIKLLTGEVDTALVYGFGKSSAGTLRRVLSRQTDPYTVAPLWPDSVSMAGLQARLGLDSGKWTHEQMARVAFDSFTNARRVDSVEPPITVGELLARPFFADPLRRHDIAPITDGAAAVVLAADNRALRPACPGLYPPLGRTGTHRCYGCGQGPAQRQPQPVGTSAAARHHPGEGDGISDALGSNTFR